MKVEQKKEQKEKKNIKQSWIFKSFSGIDADAGIDATHKIAIFK